MKKFLVPIALLAVMAGVYAFVLAPPPKQPTPKIAGDMYVVPKEFLLNLDDGRYARLTVAMVLSHKVNDAPVKESAEAKPPEGWGPSPQEGVVRALVTEAVTGADPRLLLDRNRRGKLEARLLRDLRTKTDLDPVDVVFTDLAVQ